MVVNIHSPVQVYIYGIIRNFFMPIRNTLCDTVVARDEQWLRMVNPNVLLCMDKKLVHFWGMVASLHTELWWKLFCMPLLRRREEWYQVYGVVLSLALSWTTHAGCPKSRHVGCGAGCSESLHYINKCRSSSLCFKGWCLSHGQRLQLTSWSLLLTHKLIFLVFAALLCWRKGHAPVMTSVRARAMSLTEITCRTLHVPHVCDMGNQLLITKCSCAWAQTNLVLIEKDLELLQPAKKSSGFTETER